jgi:hypothetical protein
MKIAINIILSAIAIVLAINILSTISKTQVDNIKYTFNVEQVQKGDNYTLVPKRYGLDTVNVFGVHNVEVLEINKSYSTNTYKVFITNNKIVHVMDTKDYEVK